jgi:hypothetical protein
MVQRDGIRICLAIACGVLGTLLSALAAAQTRLDAIGRGDSAAERALAEAAQRAEAKLANASCRKIFQDFRSLNGRLLQETLEEAGHTGQTYFRSLVFYEGHGRTPCDSRGILAFTSPGSRAVFVCSAQFVERAHRDPGLAAVLLIHEELHALGLGENPPSSKEITQKVIQRCGK